MRNSESDPARVVAADKLLDRGHGKAKQTLEGSLTLQVAVAGIKIALGKKLDRITQRFREGMPQE